MRSGMMRIHIDLCKRMVEWMAYSGDGIKKISIDTTTMTQHKKGLGQLSHDPSRRSKQTCLGQGELTATNSRPRSNKGGPPRPCPGPNSTPLQIHFCRVNISVSTTIIKLQRSVLDYHSYRNSISVRESKHAGIHGLGKPNCREQGCRETVIWGAKTP